MPEPALIGAASGPAVASGQTICGSCGGILAAGAGTCPGCGVRQVIPQRKPVSKATLLLLTFFLGGIGGHKFYLGKYWQGTLYLLFFWTYVPAIIALVEFVVYAFTPSDRLKAKYSAQGSVAAILAGAGGFIVMIVILAGIAIDSFNDYQKRALAYDGVALAAGLKEQIEESFAVGGPADMTCRSDHCPFASIPLGPTPNVRRIASDRTGAITIEYDERIAPAPQNRLTFIPQIDGNAADLSDARNAGKKITWNCGRDATTTMAFKLLPRSCK